MLLGIGDYYSFAAKKKDILRVSEILKNQPKNILNVSDLPKEYSTLIVDTPCNLGGKTLFLPLEADLVIEGKGYIDNGKIEGKKSLLTVKNLREVIGLNIIIAGVWCNSIVYDYWFEFDSSADFISNDIIKNIFALTNDFYFCHIYLEANRTYFFELPYKGDANLGDMLPYRMKKGVKKRQYYNLYKDKYSFLRIFTIPSRTHVSIQNTLKMLPTNQGAYFVFWEYAKNNITIDGKGVISGDVKEHIYDSPFVKRSKYFGEWGHIFCCKACSNFTFEDITIENSFGDCILYSSDYSNKEVADRRAKALVVKNVKIRYARRNGIAIGATGGLVLNTTFQGCGIDSIKGTAPRAAIDFEPDRIRIFPETGNRRVYMKSCVFINNKHDVSSTFNNLISFNKIATHISDCVFTAPLRLNTTNWIEFESCIIPNITNYKNKITEGCPVRHIIFKNCIIKKMPSIILTREWKNSFENCVFGEENKF